MDSTLHQVAQAISDGDRRRLAKQLGIVDKTSEATFQEIELLVRTMPPVETVKSPSASVRHLKRGPHLLKEFKDWLRDIDGLGRRELPAAVLDEIGRDVDRWSIVMADAIANAIANIPSGKSGVSPKRAIVEEIVNGWLVRHTGQGVVRVSHKGSTAKKHGRGPACKELVDLLLPLICSHPRK